MSNIAPSKEQHFTRELCAYLAAFCFEDLPKQVVEQARRGVLDWLGCAVAGSSHDTVDKLLDLVRDVGGRPEATAIARKTKVGLLDAALVNGVMAHVLDYDDTYMSGTVLHASAPTLAALFALAERQRCDGEAFLLSYIAGFEAAVRVARAATDHHKRGWHATGILGTIAAAVAAGKLLRLGEERMTYAMGMAATQASGLLENRDSACKALHAGKAASNGLLAALLASRGLDSSLTPIEGEQGFCKTFGKAARPEELTQSLGTQWFILGNGYKPFACAIGLHPVIEGMITLRASGSVDIQLVEKVELRVSAYSSRYRPFAGPMSGHHSKFSVHHAAAVALLDGAAGVAQFTDERASDAKVVELSSKVNVSLDASLREDQAHVAVVSAARRCEMPIERAMGTERNPLSNEAIQAKFMQNAAPVIGEERACRAAEIVWALETHADLGKCVALCE